MIDATFDGVSLATACPESVITRADRPIIGTARHEYVDVPGRAGSWQYPEEPGDATLGLDLVVLVDNAALLRAAIRKVGDWMQPLLGAAALELSDEPDRIWWATAETVPNPAEAEHDAVISIQFRVPPYSEAADPSTEPLIAVGSPDSGMFDTSSGIDTRPIIEITPTNGTLTGFTLTFNGTSLSWAGLVLDDATITVNCISDTVTAGVNGDVNLTGAFVVGAVSMQDVSGEFPSLIPGENDWAFEWTGTATTVDLDVTWRERFRS
jgi:phage-related protein